MEFNKGNAGTGGGMTLYTGFFKGEVVLVNPTKAEIEKTTGIKYPDDKEEFDYEKPSKRNEEMAQISFWFKTTLNNEPLFFNERFYLINKPAVFEKSGKSKWVNQSGMSSIVEGENSLPGWFTHFTDKEKNPIKKKEYRQAYQGEAELTEFLSRWLGGLNLFGADKEGTYANILIDRDLLFKNLAKYVKTELRPLIGSDYVRPCTKQACVTISDGDGGSKYYQAVYNDTLPFVIKDGSRWSESFKVVELASKCNDWKTNEALRKFIEKMNGDYGAGDNTATSLSLLKVFNPNEVPVQMTENTLVEPTETGTAINNSGAAFLDSEEGADY